MHAAMDSAINTRRPSMRSATTPAINSITSGGVSTSARLMPSSMASTSKWKTKSHCNRKPCSVIAASQVPELARYHGSSARPGSGAR